MTAATENTDRTATLYRMVMPEHVCPYGIKSRWLLRSRGYRVDDHHLRSRAETEAFKAEHDVSTTPQTFIGGRRIGGYDDLRAFFGKKVLKDGDTTYRPVVAIFIVALLLGAVVAWVDVGRVEPVRTLEAFIAAAMVLLGLQKLQDVEGFSTMFLNYDLLGRRWVPYAYIYPYAETLAGLLMLAQVLGIVSIPLALFIGTVGALSVVKAVYVDGRELRCACVGGGSKVPLGAVSLTENLMMVAMALWMLGRHDLV